MAIHHHADVPKAFYNPNLGFVDLVIGNSKGGLIHLFKRREEQKNANPAVDDGLTVALKLPEIIYHGKSKADYNGDAIIEHYLNGKNYLVSLANKSGAPKDESHPVVIRRSNRKWVLTGYEVEKDYEGKDKE